MTSDDSLDVGVTAMPCRSPLIRSRPWITDDSIPKGTVMALRIVPVRFRDACEFVVAHHRHHNAPIGHIFSRWNTPSRPRTSNGTDGVARMLWEAQ